VISSIPVLSGSVGISASANIKALETLGYAEHICNYVVILDSWFYGKSTRINVKKKTTFF